MKKLYLLFVMAFFTPVLFAQITKTVHLNDPGTLASSLTTELSTITDLTLTGNIDARDFKTMRDLMPVLANIDLSGVTIAAYSGTEGTSISGNTNYPVNSIPETAFMNASYQGKNSLISIIFPNTLASVEYQSFRNCRGLANIVLPSSTFYIKSYAFAACFNLKTVSIPASVSSIGTAAFGDSPVAFSVDVNNNSYCSENGILFNKSKTYLFQGPPSLSGDYEIPSTVETIGGYAFSRAEGLTSITIPSTVKYIGEGSFTACEGLTNIQFPVSVVSIGNYSFQNCTGLTSITAPWISPLVLGTSVFANLDKTKCTLKVPYGTKTAYQAANQWKDFTNIVEYDAPPVANAGNDQTVLEGKMVTLDGSGSKDDLSTTLTYQWTAPDGIILSDPTATNPTFTAPAVSLDQSFEFKLVVNDGTQNSNPSSVKVTVRNTTFVPDDNFEQALIALGYDSGPLDDYVLTSTISSAFALNVSNRNIADLTGIEGFSKLIYLNCSSNKLTKLDVSRNTELTNLTCNSNQLSSLDVSNNKSLKILSCYSNQLTALDVSNNTVLLELWCYINQLTSLDVSNNLSLTKLACFSNQLSVLDVSKNTALDYLSCGGNSLITIDVTKNIALTSLSCGRNKLTALDVSKNSNLRSLFLNDNQLTTIDISNNILIQEFGYKNNKIGLIDLSKNIALTNLECSGNQISQIDISKNIGLKYFYCDNNLLTNLNLSHHSLLQLVVCRSNSLITLNLKNGNNANMIGKGKGLFADNNTNLTCIQVDDPVLAATYTEWRKDEIAGYSTDCPPIANAGNDQTVNEGDDVILNGSLSSDADIDNLSYQWSAPSGITLSSKTDQKPTFTAPEVTYNTELTFNLTVTDIGGNTSSDEVIVTVLQVNKAPVAKAGVDQTVTMGALVTLDGSSSSDADNDALTYKWTAPQGIVIDNESVEKPTFTAPLVNQNTSYNLILVVNDGQTDSESDEVTVQVVNPYSPIAKCNDITVQLDATGHYSLSSADLALLTAGTEDDVNRFNKLKITAEPNAYSCADLVNPVEVNVTITDLTNNVATCKSEVIVKDVTAPVFAAYPKTINQSVAAGKPYILPSLYETYTATDACGNLIIYTQNPEPGKAYSAPAKEIVTITAADASGNVAQIKINLNITLNRKLKSAEIDIPDATDTSINFQVYPNPTTGIVNIVANRKNVSVEILTSSGVSILKKHFYEAPAQIDLGEYAEGIYFVKINSAEEQGVFKIVFKK